MKIFLAILPFKNTLARKNDICLMNYVKLLSIAEKELIHKECMEPLEGIGGRRSLTTFCLPCS